MKKQKLCKTLVAGAISVCLMTTSLGYAYGNENMNVPQTGIQVFENGEPTPHSMYFHSCSLDVFPSNGVMAVNITTKASRHVDRIYHDVTIYKNGIWLSSNRYENQGQVQLASYLSVSAQPGDYIDVYVDHYTEHGGYVESAHSAKACYF